MRVEADGAPPIVVDEGGVWVFGYWVSRNAPPDFRFRGAIESLSGMLMNIISTRVSRLYLALAVPFALELWLLGNLPEAFLREATLIREARKIYLEGDEVFGVFLPDGIVVCEDLSSEGALPISVWALYNGRGKIVAQG